MKKILALLSLILFLIVGFFATSNPSSAQNICNNLALNAAQESIVNTIDDGIIQSYNLTNEHYFLNKNENNNFFNIFNETLESQLGNAIIKSMDSFDTSVALSHSNNILDLSRVYLTQASPRAP